MPPRINLPGLELRKKSSIHSNIIDVNTGRRKNNIPSGMDATIKGYKYKSERWTSNGIYIDDEKIYLDVIKLNKNKIKRSMDILILGPGKGREVTFLKEELHKKNNIDTMGLTNYLSDDANKLKRKDYSPAVLNNKTVFEHFNHLNLVGKYDYIYSHLGPGYHTIYPEIVCLKAASMLRTGGFARIRVDNPKKIIEQVNDYLKSINEERKLEMNIDSEFIIIKRLK